MPTEHDAVLHAAQDAAVLLGAKEVFPCVVVVGGVEKPAAQLPLPFALLFSKDSPVSDEEDEHKKNEEEGSIPRRGGGTSAGACKTTTAQELKGEIRNVDVLLLLLLLLLFTPSQQPHHQQT